MLNSKETLKKLHKKFPQMSLDDLFDILDCYVEEYNFFTKPYWYETNTDFRIKDASTNPLFKNYDGNISTTAKPRGIQLATGY